MALTITSAQWGNTDQTSAVVTTVELGAVAISQQDNPNVWDKFLQWASNHTVLPCPVFVPPTPTQILNRLFNRWGITPADFKTYIGA